ncbi:MAG: hypothetical protein IJ738_00385 [Alphaproteobacteria bacterium]|nr:hypothetical protein [Alphaproteobacteria bacterium]
MKTLYLFALAIVLGGISPAWAQEENDFGLEDMSAIQENLPPSEEVSAKVEQIEPEIAEKTDKAETIAEQKAQETEAKLDAVIQDIDAEIVKETPVKEETPKEVEEQKSAVAETITEGVKIQPEQTSEEISVEPAQAESEAAPQEVSAYVQKLNLSEEQLDKAMFISAEMAMRQEQLQKSADLLKAQAKEIETQSLEEFEAILTPEQLEIFRQIRQKNELAQ